MRLGHDFQALNDKKVIISWLEACFYNKTKQKYFLPIISQNFGVLISKLTLLEVWLIFTGVLVSKSKF